MTAITEFSIAIQKRVGRQRLRKGFLGSIPFIFLIFIWELNSHFVWLDPIEIPPLSEVWGAIFFMQSDCPGFVAAMQQHNDCNLTNNIISSLGRVILAGVVGIPLGLHSESSPA